MCTFKIIKLKLICIPFCWELEELEFEFINWLSRALPVNLRSISAHRHAWPLHHLPLPVRHHRGQTHGLWGWCVLSWLKTVSVPAGLWVGAPSTHFLWCPVSLLRHQVDASMVCSTPYDSCWSQCKNKVFYFILEEKCPPVRHDTPDACQGRPASQVETHQI